MNDTVLAPSYQAPPIIEAVIQIRFAEPLTNANYLKTTKRMKRSYANEVATENVGANIDFQNRAADFRAIPQARLSSEDEADILVVESSSLTWSRLPPYLGWEAFLERAKRDTEIAHAAVGHRKIERLGVRYINRIDVPLPTGGGVVRYEDYLTINLSLPHEWDAINSYAWRFERTFPGIGLLVIVQSAAIAPEIPDHAAFLLDIDVVAANDLPTKLEDVFAKLGEMRALKNKVFEVSITDMARASFS